MADVNTNTATQTQEQGNGTQTNTTANANTTGAGADTTPKAKTEEEIRAELQKEYEKMADKRVTDAIKKKEKEWADKQAKEKMTEDERRQAEEQERLQAQAKRDLDLTIKGLKLDVVDAVQEMGLDAGFRNLIAVEDLATITDEDERKAKAFGVTYNRFESDFGVLNMVLNRHVKADALLAVDLEQVQIAELRPTFYEDLPKGGDYEKGHIINESTIKLLNSYAGAKIINISK